MVPFKYLNNYYSETFPSYTSNDEFILNKRIWENNELPALDPFAMIHSMLKDDLWEWFLGTTSMSYDVPYNYETIGEEYFDDTGIITDASIAKYVNKVRAKNYGPIPTYNFEKDKENINGGMTASERIYALKEDLTPFTSEDINTPTKGFKKGEWIYRPIWPSYTRYEVDGTIAPEWDFLIHEGYRYLNNLYPNHPDIDILLTTNEINDEFNQISTLMNFKINCPFYDWLSTQLDYSDDIKEQHLYSYYRKEAIKLKYRNLKNNTFRRKLYGAKAGYWMFGSEALQHTSIYPVAEYLPLKPLLREEVRNKNIDYKWYKKLLDAPEIFEEKIVNYEDTFYTHPFRLLDFSNTSYDLKNRYQPPPKIWGTAYPSPLSPYDIYEYPVERDIYIPLTIQEDFYEGQKVWIGERFKDNKERDQDEKIPAYLNAMFYENSYRVNLFLNYYDDSSLNEISSELNTTILEETISHIQVTAPVYPIYTRFKLRDSMKEMMRRAIENNADFSNFSLETTTLGKIQELCKLVVQDPERSEVDVAIEIHQNGNIFLPPQQFLSLYYDNLNISISRSDYTPTIHYLGTGINDIDGFIRTGDLLIKDDHPSTNPEYADGNKNFISEICGLEGAKLLIKIEKPIPLTLSVYENIKNMDHTKVCYGLVLELSKNNQESPGWKVIIFGYPDFSNSEARFTGPDYNGNYFIDNFDFIVTSIPRIKSINELKLLYKDFSPLSLQKVDNLSTIFGKAEDLDSENLYKKYCVEEIDEINSNFSKFKQFLNSIAKRFDVENATRRSLTKSLDVLLEMFLYSDEKHSNLKQYLKDFNINLDSQLIIGPDKTKFYDLTNNLLQTISSYQEDFYSDLLNIRFPIGLSVIGIKNQVEKVKFQINDIFNIIKNIEEGKDLWSILDGDYNIFYEFFQTFLDFFEYSPGQNGLQRKVQGLLPPFKKYADDAVFSIKIQPTIHKIKITLDALKEEVAYIFDILDKGGQAPYPILKGENFVTLQEQIEIYKDFYKTHFNYSTVEREINSYMHEVYNAVAAILPQIFDNHAERLYKKVEEFRNPFIQDPTEYIPYLNAFIDEINKYHKIFLDDLVDMPILTEGYIVRFPIEANMRIFRQCLEDFIKAFDDELEHWLTTISYSNAILTYFKYENIIRLFHFMDPNDNVDELKRQLNNEYFIQKTHIGSQSINYEDFLNDKTLIINTFNNYINFYNNHLKEMITADINRRYYQDLDTDKFTSEQKRAYSSLLGIDEKLNQYLPNRGLLLKPLPEDIYLRGFPDFNHSYSLLNFQDLYLGIFNFEFDIYNTFIKHEFIKEFSNKGTMDNYYPGNISTAQLIHNDNDTNPSENQFRPANDYIINYTAENGEIYPSLNESIIRMNIITSNTRKFSYCHEEWLELFLPERYKYNIEGELTKRYEVEIRSIITKNSTKIEFIDDESKKRIYALTTGDQIIGPNIEDDTFIEAIDLFNFVITTNKPLNVSGDFVLTYMTLYNLYPSEFKSNNFFDYRVELSHSGKRDRKNEPTLVREESILEHGVFGSEDYPNISQNYVDGFIDIKKYQEDLLYNLKTQSAYSKYFNIIVKNSHNDNKNLMEYTTQPSFINYFGSAYFEVNAHRIYEKEYVMVKEVLDYFQDYLHELSRASDVVNVGVNILATTDTSGKVSSIPGQKYSDPNINLRFITTSNWSEMAIPTYIELGIGCLEEAFRGFEMEGEAQERSTQTKFYYDYDIYDLSPQDIEDLKKKGITYDNDTGAFYSVQEIDSNLENPVSYVNHVDIPVITYKLGEYEVQKMIEFGNYFDKSKKFTTIQFSIIKQCFKNILITGNPLKQITKNFIDYKLFNKPSTNYHIVDFDEKGDYHLFYNNEDYINNPDLNDLKNITYRGEWIPNSISRNNRNEVNYPADESNMDTIYYYYISKSAILSSVFDKYENKLVDKNYKFGTILVWEGKWILKDFSFAGFLGDLNREEDLLISEPPEDINDYHIPNLMVPGINTFNSNHFNNSLKRVLIVKVLSYSGIFANITENEMSSLTTADLLLLFNNICNNTWSNLSKIEISDKIKQNFSSYFYSKDTVYWFYTLSLGTSGIWRNALGHIKENPLIFSLIYTNNNFYIYIINYNKGFYLIDHSNKLGLKYQEYGILSGLYGGTKNKLLPFERINEYQNTIQLAYSNLIPGSIDFDWKLLPHFIVNGYPYENNKLNLLVENQYDITEDIYFDREENYLYSYTNNRKDKFAIKQENNKYFKNVLYLYCNYSTELITQGTNVFERGKLTAIDTVIFDSALTNLKDRLLEIEQINVRSRYNENFESTQFSNYLLLTGIIKGIFVKQEQDKEDKLYLSIGFKKDEEPENTGNRLKYQAELEKIRPEKYNTTLEKNEEWPLSVINFDEYKKTYWDDGEFFNSPIIQSSEVFRDLTLDPDTKAFRYYKNTLILEGKLDIINPGLIDFSDNPKLYDALNRVATGDKIVDIVGLNSLKSKSYIQFKICEVSEDWKGDPEIGVNRDVIIEIKAIDYNGGYLVGSGDTKFFIHPCADLKNLGSFYKDGTYEIYVKKSNFNETKTNSGDILTSLSFDSDNSRWIFAFSNTNYKNSDFYSLDIFPEPELNGKRGLKLVYDKPGIDVNSNQIIKIIDEDFRIIGDNLQEEYSGYNIEASILARDLSIERDDNIMGALVPITDVVGLNTGTLTYSPVVNGVTRQNGRQFSSDGDIITITLDQLSSPYGYKTVTFLLNKASITGSCSIGVPQANSAVKEIWIYNHNTGMWEKNKNIKTFYAFITDFDASDQYIPVTSYIISEDSEFYHTIPGSSEFVLRDLPTPEDINTTAIILNTGFNSIPLRIFISGGNFNIFDFRVSTPKKFLKDLEYYKLKEGPYFPLLNDYNDSPVLNKDSQFLSKRWATYYGNNQALIIGNILFIKSPTKTVKSKTRKNNEDKRSWEYDGGITIRPHWKRATLPSLPDINYSLFNEMTLQEAYNFVNEQYIKIKGLLTPPQFDSSKVDPQEKDLYDQFINFLNLPQKKDANHGNAYYTGPLKCITDEDLQVNIDVFGVCLYQTENDIIPYFDSTKNYFWQSTIDSKFELGDKIDVYLKKQNYFRYLADYYHAILGTRRFEYLFTEGGIKDVILTNDSLVIHTKYDDIVSLNSQYFGTRRDIENYHNWTFTNIDSKYLFNTDISNNTRLDRVMGIRRGKDDVFVTAKLMPISYPDKKFTILNKYIENNISIYCGYVKADSAVLQAYQNYSITDPNSPEYENHVNYRNALFELFPNNSSVISGGLARFSDGSRYPKYPVIYSSTDHKNFTRIDIPTQDFVTNISSYSFSETDLEAYSIIREGTEIKVYFRNTDSDKEPKGYTSFTVGTDGIRLSLSHNANLVPMSSISNVEITKLTAREVKNSFVDSLNAVLIGNLTSNGVYSGTLNKFLLAQQYRPDVGQSRITLKGDNSITYSPAPIESLVSEILNVLVAIDTKYLIQEQKDYLDFDPRYINDATGNLKVSEYTEVGSINNANRMYSPRECIPVSLRNQFPKRGMPAISEDIDRNVYKYGNPYLDQNGVTIYPYIEARNNEKEFVYLCDENGGYLAQRDIVSLSQIYNLQKLIEGDIPILNLARAGVVRDDYSAVRKDENLEYIMNNILKLKNIKYISFDNLDPYLYIDIPINASEYINYLEGKEIGDKIELEKVKEEYKLELTASGKIKVETQFYLWPKDGTKIPSVNDLKNLYYYNTVTQKIANKQDILSNDFTIARSYIEQYEGIFEESKMKSTVPFDGRFIPYKINNEWYIMDSTTKTVMIKEQHTIKNNFNVPYIFKNGIQIFTNREFNVVREDTDHMIHEDSYGTLISPNEIYPITSMYLPHGGYGGYLYNDSWIERPDEVDFKAWDHFNFLKNCYGELIYLSDYRGNKLNLKHGLFFLDPTEKVAVTYHNIAYEGKNYFTVSEDLNDIKEPYNIYKISPAKPTIYSPKSSIWLNHNYTKLDFVNSTSTLTTDTETLALIKIIKSGVEVPFGEIKSYEFLDYEDKPLIFNFNTTHNFNLRLVEENRIKIKYTPSSNGFPTVDGNKLKLRIIDIYDQSAEIEFNIEDNDEKEPLRILDISEIYTYDNIYINNTSTEIKFDRCSFSETDDGYKDIEIIQTEDLGIMPPEISIERPTKSDTSAYVSVVFSVKEILTSTRVLYSSNRVFNLDIRSLDLSLTLLRNWTNTSNLTVNQLKSEFKLNVYSGDRSIDNLLNTKYSMMVVDNINYIVATVGDIKISEPYKIINGYIAPSIENQPFIFLNNNAIINHTFTKKVLIDGLYGQVIIKVPEYESFKDLLDKLEYIIEYKNRRIISTYNGITKEEINRFSDIAKNNSYIILEDLINYKFRENNPYLRIRVLPIQTIYANLKTANNPDYIEEITQKEISTFGIDRIWVNKNAYLLPPVKIGNMIYNSENIPYYYENKWKNKDYYSVYSCNEEGKYVKFVPTGRDLLQRVIGNSRGDVREEIFGNVDPRHNILEPIYKSSLDWFLSEFYIEGKESNPFNLHLNLYENIKNNSYHQEMNVTQLVKQNGILTNKELYGEYVTKVLKNILYLPSKDGSVIRQDVEIEYMDYLNGIINFTIIEPTQKYRDNERLTLYGINFYNQYYLYDTKPAMKNVWSSSAYIDNKINMRFDINSFEDYLDKKNKDIAIRWYTEMGVFDQFGKLIAYCHHPKVEYRTDSQHISYTLIISEES